MTEKLKSIFVVPGPAWIAIATAVIGLLQTYFNDWTMTGSIVTGLTVVIKLLQMAMGGAPAQPAPQAMARSAGGVPVSPPAEGAGTKTMRFLFGA